MKLTTFIVNARINYGIQLGENTTVGRIARYLSQQEADVDGSTLEVARVVAPTQKLQDVDIQSGDRLIIFTNPPEKGQLNAPLTPGDKVLTLSIGNVEVSSRGKKTLMMGKPDTQRDGNVDIDLRSFVPPKALGFISRETLRLEFDDRAKTWFASRLGKTRILMDELEIGAERTPMSDVCTLRLYRAGDDPRSPAYVPLAQFNVDTETVKSSEDIIYLEQGGKTLNVQVGQERDSLTLNVSENIAVGQIVTNLAAHLNVPLGQGNGAYLLRLLPPGTAVKTLNLGQDEFLYAVRSQTFALNALILRDIGNRERAFTLVAGPEDDVKLIGRRPEASLEDPELDVDLFEAVIKRDDKPDTFKSLSRRQLKVFYKAAENAWWVQLEDRASVPVFINNTRTTNSAPIQLTSGDVLSFGPSLDNYYARLEVDITNKAE